MVWRGLMVGKSTSSRARTIKRAGGQPCIQPMGGSLFTAPAKCYSCSVTPSSNGYSGFVNQTSCYHAINGNVGCGITYSNPASYGAAFAQIGGGVFVAELAISGISIWFFERRNIPAEVSNATFSIDTRQLGTPSSFWSSAGCDIAKYFSPQTLTFTITLVSLDASLVRSIP